MFSFFLWLIGTTAVNLQHTIFLPNVKVLCSLLVEPQYTFCTVGTHIKTHQTPHRKALHWKLHGKNKTKPFHNYYMHTHLYIWIISKSKEWFKIRLWMHFSYTAVHMQKTINLARETKLFHSNWGVCFVGHFLEETTM